MLDRGDAWAGDRAGIGVPGRGLPGGPGWPKAIGPGLQEDRSKRILGLSESAARRTAGRNRNVLNVHEDSEHRATTQTSTAVALRQS